MSDNNQKKTEDSVGGVPEKPETEPQGQADIHEFSSAEELEKEGLPDNEAELDAEALRSEIVDLKDKLLRAMAEVENVRRRAEKQTMEARKFGISSFARDLMAVADNFQRARALVSDDIGETDPEFVANLIAGIEMTERGLMTAFETNGIRPIEPVPGDKFDPNVHQAIAEIPGTEFTTGSIVQVSQSGYALDDRLLRPAMVLVARDAEQPEQSAPRDAPPDEAETVDPDDHPDTPPDAQIDTPG